MLPGLRWGLLLLVCLAPVRADPLAQWQQAIRGEDTAGLTRLLARGAGVNAPAPDGRTALMIAAKRADRALTRSLLAAGARVDATNRNGGTALMYAAISGDVAIGRLLLAHGAEVNATASFDWTATMVACAKGHAAFLRLLLSHGADPNAVDAYGWTPLMRAAFEDRRDVVEVLTADRRVDVNAADPQGVSALHLVAAQGHAAAARLLLAAGADMTRVDGEQHTPPEVARLSGHEQLASLLEAAAHPP